MHRLLLRQIKRHLGGVDRIPPELADLLEAVSAAYEQADDDRKLLERSLELTSGELLDRNAELRNDIAHREEVEKALRESEARTAAILDAIPDCLLVLHRNGSVEERDVSTSTGEPCCPLETGLRQSVASSAVERLEEAFERRSPLQWEHRVDVDGKQHHYEVRLVATGDERAVAIVRDVTETREMQERLLTSDRMASVGTLAAGVAHEINNPLTYVITNLSYLADDLTLYGPGSASEARLALEEARMGAERVRRIVSDLKTFSRADKEELGPVDVHEVIESTLNMAISELRHRAKLVREFGDVPRCRANASRLGQVFLNLLMNAAQALPIGRAKENTVTVRTATEGNDVLVHVSDSGAGISPEVMRRIFDPFFTTKEVGVGTGLGLSICHNIVRSMSGEISVASTLGEGTTFTVRLPMSDGTTSLRMHESLAPRSVRPRRVLVIDDEPEVGRAVRRVLRQHHVEVVRSGSDGLRVLRNDPTVDLVLCDLMMPNVSGMELYEMVRQEHPHLAERFVFVTGGAFSREAQDFLEDPERRVLEKPFDVSELRDLVAELARVERSLAPPRRVSSPLPPP